MGFLVTRLTVLGCYLKETLHHQPISEEGVDDADTVILLDGVGGWRFGSTMMRRALRASDSRWRRRVFDWHHGLRGDLLTDLMSLKANRVMACRLARLINALHREAPDRKISLVAFSGGCGITLLALEYLKRPLVDTAVLLAPAVSPRYNLGPALRRLRRCYVGVSRRDVFLLGAGTRLFGTIDRVFGVSAGLRGFRRPLHAAEDDLAAYARLRQIPWEPDLRSTGHAGGHTGWIHPEFLSRHLSSWLEDRPARAYHEGFMPDAPRNRS